MRVLSTVFAALVAISLLALPAAAQDAEPSAEASAAEAEATAVEATAAEAADAESADAAAEADVDVSGLPRLGEPAEWAIGFQDPATPIMDQIENFSVFIHVIIIPIGIVVFALLAWIVYRFRESRNPEPAKFHHNTLLEVVWTAVPAVIVIVTMAISLPLITDQERTPEAELTIVVRGQSWYWDYEYQNDAAAVEAAEAGEGELAFDVEGIQFSSYILTDEEVEAMGGRRLLEVDRRLVLPANTNIRFQITSGGVLHSFAVPAFGIKRDAVPGRFNEAWANIREEGVYYGQCSEICGPGHAYMPITVEVISREDFAEWIEQNRPQSASLNTEELTRQAALEE